MAQDEAVALLEALCEHASQDRFVTNHRQFDLIHRISEVVPLFETVG